MEFVLVVVTSMMLFISAVVSRVRAPEQHQQAQAALTRLRLSVASCCRMSCFWFSDDGRSNQPTDNNQKKSRRDEEIEDEVDQ